ncbi:MAG TPA: PAS domain-containing protein [Actinomycetes bacterium]
MSPPLDERETRFLRTVAENTPVVLWAMDPQGVCTYSTGKGLESLGVAEGATIGRNMLELYAGSPTVVQNIQRALAGESFRSEVEQSGVVFETWFQPRLADDGSLAEVLAVSVDVTEAIQARKAQHDLAEQHRSMLLQMLAAQEAERHELAGRMHDDTIQVLSAVDLRVQLLKKRLDDEVHTELADEVHAVHLAVHQAVDRLRGVLFALDPPQLGEGLVGALKDLASAIFQGTRVAFEVVVESDQQIGEQTARVLYRIAAEALSNVARHAAAQFVVITLAAESFGWSLTVVDDGQGPGEEGFAERPGHRGLAGMRERVQEAGGTLALHAVAGGGTQVRAWLPTRVGALLGSTPPLDLREPLREILDESDEAFVALDRDWNYVFVNKRAADLADRPARELEGKNIWEEFPSAVGSTFYVQCLRAMAEQRTAEFADFAGGRWLENRLLPTRQGLFAYYRDVTEQRRSWQRADHSGDAGALLLVAVARAADVTEPVERVQRMLQSIVESRWFSAARVYGPDGAIFAEASTPDDREDPSQGLIVTGSLLLSEPLLGGVAGRVEFEGRVPVHLAVRWLARVVAALVTPAVMSDG